MSILKSKIRNKFSTIPNSVIRAKDLSDGEYRLLIYLYSLPDGWKINQTYLGAELGCNRNNINLKIGKIKQLGYLEIIKANKETGNDYIYVLKEKDVLVNNAPVTDTVLVNDAPVTDTVLVNDAPVTDTYINTNIINTEYKVIDNIYKEKKSSPKFIKPTIEELKEYCNSINLKVDCEKFYDYYESNGWCVGKNKMKDWKATIRNWNRNDFNNQKQNTTHNPNDGYVPQHRNIL